MNNVDKENEIREEFNVYDKDRSGKISKSELVATMRELGAENAKRIMSPSVIHDDDEASRTRYTDFPIAVHVSFLFIY